MTTAMGSMAVRRDMQERKAFHRKVREGRSAKGVKWSFEDRLINVDLFDALR